MIKTIKKIDLNGNEVWQEVCVCNRCKKPLEPADFVYETKWTAWHPVKMEGCCAYGFGEGSNPVKHICEDCQKEVEAFLNGETFSKPKTFHKLTTFQERVDSMLDYYREQSTEALREFSRSCMCSVESGKAIEIVLKERLV